MVSVWTAVIMTVGMLVGTATLAQAGYLPSDEDEAFVKNICADSRNVLTFEAGFVIQYGETHMPGDVAAMGVTDDGLVWRLEEWSYNNDGTLRMKYWQFWKEKAVTGALTFRSRVVVSRESSQRLTPQDTEAVEKSQKTWRLLRRVGQSL